MHLKTGINWLDSDISDLSSSYIQCNHDRIRQGILSRSIATATERGEAILLTSPRSETEFWSFNLEEVLGRAGTYTDFGRIRDNLRIERVRHNGRPADTDWDELQQAQPATYIVDRPTNLRTRNRSRTFSPLDRIAEQLTEFSAPLLVLDHHPPYRQLSRHIEGIITVEWRENRLERSIVQHPVKQASRKIVSLDTGQKTLEEYTEAII